MHAGFERVSAEVVFEGLAITVGRYRYETPSGFMSREVVEAPGSVVVLPWTGSQVVMLKQFRAAADDWIYELPAGKRDITGEPPETAATRECVEEVGLLPGSLKLLHVFYNSPGYTDERSWLYLAEDLKPVSARPQGPEESAAEVVHLSLETCFALADSGEIADAKTLIGLYAVAKRLS